MSYNPNFADAYCPAILQLADEGCASPSNTTTPVGLMQFLLSSANANTVEFQDNGKFQPIDVTWSWRSTPDQVSSTYDICTPGDEPVHRSFRVEWDMISTIKKTIPEDQMRRLCEDMSPYMANQLAMMLDAIRADVNQKLHTRLLTVNTPLWGGGVPAAVDLYVGTDPGGGPSLTAIDYVLNSLSDIAGNCIPALVGNGDLRLATRALGYGCCNDGGVDIGNLRGEYMFFKDIHSAQIHGNGTFLAIAPGALQLITWNGNQDAYRGVPRGGSIERTILTDPLSGLNLDLDIRYDECNRAYTMALTTHYTLLWIQNDRYSPTDPLYQTKGFIKFPQTP